MNIIKQSTYETCLACCLLILIDQDNKDEVEIWKHGWAFNYLIGQLNFVSDKYNRNVEAYIENIYYFNQLQEQKGKGVELINRNIDCDYICEQLKTSKVIIYVDNYYLQGILHAPHFILGTKEVGDQIEIVDPGDGKVKLIAKETISKGINSLRSHLGYSPVLIRLSK